MSKIIIPETNTTFVSFEQALQGPETQMDKLQFETFLRSKPRGTFLYDLIRQRHTNIDSFFNFYRSQEDCSLTQDDIQQVHTLLERITFTRKPYIGILNSISSLRTFKSAMITDRPLSKKHEVYFSLNGEAEQKVNQVNEDYSTHTYKNLSFKVGHDSVDGLYGARTNWNYTKVFYDLPIFRDLDSTLELLQEYKKQYAVLCRQQLIEFPTARFSMITYRTAFSRIIYDEKKIHIPSGSRYSDYEIFSCSYEKISTDTLGVWTREIKDTYRVTPVIFEYIKPEVFKVVDKFLKNFDYNDSDLYDFVDRKSKLHSKFNDYKVFSSVEKMKSISYIMLYGYVKKKYYSNIVEKYLKEDEISKIHEYSNILDIVLKLIPLYRETNEKQ